MRIDCCGRSSEGSKETAQGPRPGETEALLVQLAPASQSFLSTRLASCGLRVLNRATDAVLIVVEGNEDSRRQVLNEIREWPEVRQIGSLFVQPFVVPAAAPPSNDLPT